MGIKVQFLNSIAKRKVACFGHIAEGHVLEGSIDGKRLRAAQGREWTDNIKDWFTITDYGSLRRTSEDGKAGNC